MSSSAPDSGRARRTVSSTSGTPSAIDSSLLKKIYKVDPLACPCCGSRMEIIAFIEDWSVIRKILQHLNLWEHSPRSPPGRRLLPHKLEAFLATLSPRQAQQVRASTDAVFWDDVPVYRG
jgi:hypothetical protein